MATRLLKLSDFNQKENQLIYTRTDLCDYNGDVVAAPELQVLTHYVNFARPVHITGHMNGLYMKAELGVEADCGFFNMSLLSNGPVQSHGGGFQGDYLFSRGDVNISHAVEAGEVNVHGSMLSHFQVSSRRHIHVKGDLTADKGLSANFGIKAKTIFTNGRIFAGIDPTSPHPFEDERGQVICEEIKKGKVAYGQLVIVPAGSAQKFSI